MHCHGASSSTGGGLGASHRSLARDRYDHSLPPQGRRPHYHPTLTHLYARIYGFIEAYEESDKALVLVSIANIIKVVPRKEDAYLHLAVQNARGLPYVVSTSGSYEEVKAKIEAAQ
jgi:hypothetical protein